MRRAYIEKEFRSETLERNYTRVAEFALEREEEE